MQIKIEKRSPQSIANGCQVLFLFDDGKFIGSAKKINALSTDQISNLFASKDFTAQPSQTLLLHNVTGCIAERLLLVGLGDRKTVDTHRWRLACQAAAAAAKATPSKTVYTDALTSVKTDLLDKSAMAEHLAREMVSETYTFILHERASKARQSTIAQLLITTDSKSLDVVTMAAKRGHATAVGMAAARDLGNLAPNICTPAYLADRAAELSNQFENLTYESLDEKAMEELGMGAFLAVSQGSEQPGKLISMSYQGRKRSGTPIVLVGKGITFDTGGISIKPSDGLDEMKYDMCGAAAVFGVMEAVARLQLEINLVGLVAAAENMPDGKAARPGDVVISMSGQSIEILNTDAEGRLVLCDALTYAERFKPAAVIDIATLTGACVVALGKSRSGVMGNHQDTINQLLEAGDTSGDATWQLPIDDEYQSLLDSNFADMANIGGRAAGAITAACFLSRFAKNFHWAHLDIAGIASLSGKNKGATGRPVPLLMSYLFAKADQ